MVIIKNLFLKDNTRNRLMAVEMAGLVYCLFTVLLVLLLRQGLPNYGTMLMERVWIIVGTFAVYGIYRLLPYRIIVFLRVAYQMVLLAYWYPDTYEFNKLFPNLDHLFASAEQYLFHCQPAVEFYRIFSSSWFSEAFNLGYFSYYPMIFTIVVFYLLYRYADFSKASFILVASFFIYYIIYIFVPVAGPQFYFPAIGNSNLLVHHFPELGDYFRYNPTLMPNAEHGAGFFYDLVEKSQEVGERPTAAFPSSHVGISTIVMILAFKVSRKLTWLLLPFYVLLCCATVYIQAHYLIDVLAGWVSSFVVYQCVVSLYNFCRRSKPQ